MFRLLLVSVSQIEVANHWSHFSSRSISPTPRFKGSKRGFITRFLFFLSAARGFEDALGMIINGAESFVYGLKE